MPQFDNFEDLYSHLEEKSLDYRYAHQIGNLFKELRDSFHEKGRKKDSLKAQWEIDFFNFQLIDGNCKPTWTGTQEDGREFEYPSLKRITNEALEYLIARLDSSKNILLRARYSHILWCSKRRHSKYAEISIDCYLLLVDEFVKKDIKKPEENYGNNVLQYIKNAYYLSQKVKYKFDTVKNKIIELVKNFNPNSSYHFALKFDLIKLMLKHNKKFAGNDFEGIPDVCWNLAHKLMQEGRIHNSIDILQLGEKVEKKTNTNQYEWQREIANAFETLTYNSTSNMSAITFCKSAIQYYKRLKLKDKVIELENHFKKLRENLELGEIKTEIDLTGHVKNCKRIASEISKLNSWEIINILINDKNLLPRKSELELRVKKNAKDFPLQHLVPITIHDSAGNPVQHFSTDDEKLYYHILNQYSFDLRYDKSYLIHEIIYKSIINEKITSDILLNFFRKYSWFGQNLEKKVFNKIITYNWLPLIMPAIHDYIFQINNLLYVEGYYPNLVLAIDSLTLKLEGLFRDFCHFAGITTFYFKKDNQNRDLAREKDINILLREKPVQEFFDEDDLLFFKYLLVEKAGLNLRHKVAHSLMFFEEYNIYYFHLLFLCLLKLGKYNFKFSK